MAKTGKTLQREAQQLKMRGFTTGDLNNVAQKRTWYRPDGLALHNLPCDPYHRERYIARGWSLTPPRHVEDDADVAQEAQDDADDFESQEEKPTKRQAKERAQALKEELEQAAA